MARVLLIFGLFLAAAIPAAAQDAGLGPAIPKATGEPHPEGNGFWRRNHMDLMKHDRDLTMYDGDREILASLSECFECHTATDTAGTPVTYEDPGHFCRTCHDFAAVKVDCFMCHRSTPEDFEEPPLHTWNREAADLDRLQAYLDGAIAPWQTLEATE
uniref:Sulfur oxidation protein DsrJ n=1 Tax=uncultured bacterium ws101A12 TaxID=1131826 RepID=I1X4H6_9BACT|nr:sulfur oxidation protein DsrJ [uncultured bacterium ws101A12]